MAVAELDDRVELGDVIKRTGWQKFIDLVRHQPLGAVGGVILMVILGVSIFAEIVTVYDPEEINFKHMLQSPNAVHWLGTDQFGRDLLTRLIYGARTALFIGLTCAFLGATSGLVLGVASAYFGGTFDLLLMRFIDVFMAFPVIIMALAIVSIFGSSIPNVIFAITLPIIPDCARVVRSSALSIRSCGNTKCLAG